MRLIARLMPGNLVSSAFTTCLCLASCALTLLSDPVNLVPLFILSAVSLGAQIPVLFMLGVHAFQQRTAMAVCDSGKMRGVHQAGNQLGLTLIHTVIWLVIVAVYISDLAHSLSPPHRITCPSASCSRYGLAISVAYVILFTFIAQLLGFALIIYEVQSAPRRVLADRSLATVLKKSVPQLVAIREETRRVRSLGDDRADIASPRLVGATYAETTGALRRAERTLSVASLQELAGLNRGNGEKRGRRRYRTASASILLTDTRLRTQQITLDEARPVVVHAAAGPSGEADGAVELFNLRRSVRIQDDRDLAWPVEHTDTKRSNLDTSLAKPFGDDWSADRYSFFRNPRKAPAPPLDSSPAGRRSLLSGRALSPAQAESAVLPFDPSMVPSSRSALRSYATMSGPLTGPFSPESRYSRWSADMATPRANRRVSVDTVFPRQGEEGVAAEMDSPKDEHVLTPM